MDLDGGVDLADYILRRLDFVLAGFHDICFEPKSLPDNTTAMIAALANPLIDAISHPGNPQFPVDQRAVVRAAVQYGKALEINNSSFRIRTGSAASCADLAAICVEEGALVVCGSDAHYWRDVGKVPLALDLIKAAHIPSDRVINSSEQGFYAFMERRKRDRNQTAGG